MNVIPTPDGEDAPRPSHPENPPRCHPCEGSRHDDCTGRAVGGKKCRCDCSRRARTKRHDWLDDRFSDEIDLERAMGDAPPYALVLAAETAGLFPGLGESGKDSAWRWLGKYRASGARPSTVDGRWALRCKRCSAEKKIGTKRFALDVPTRVYRVGRCASCRTTWWFELLV